MSDSEHSSADAGQTSLGERIEVVAEFADIAGRLTIVGELKWREVEADYRILAVNSALRRQLESLQASIVLCRQGYGHLAVSFVRPALEDVMYLAFFTSLQLNESQKLFELMNRWDALRSLLAQRVYVGDSAMAKLWFPREFLDGAVEARERTKSELKELQKKYKWSGGLLPSGDWVADRSGQRRLYDYLHAATSRAVHFSANEIMRRAWGSPSGILITDKPEFRDHLAAFALDQQWRLLLDTWKVVLPTMHAAGIQSDEALQASDLTSTLGRLNAMGRVPLVHAYEWNLHPPKEA